MASDHEVAFPTLDERDLAAMAARGHTLDVRAGDVRAGSAKRVAAAVGEGAMAVGFVHAHIARPV